MAEIALRTTERRSDRAWRPVGSTIVCLSNSLIRRKWLEIFCEFARPKKRNTDPKFKDIPGWDRICEAWTPALWKAWFEADRPQEVSPVELSDHDLVEKISLADSSINEPGPKDPIVSEILNLSTPFGGINTPKDFRDAWMHFDRPLIAYPLGRLLTDVSYPQNVWQDLIEPIGVLADFSLAPESDIKAHDTWLWNEAERKRYFIIVNDDADDEEVEGWQTSETRDGDLGIVLPELEPGQEYDKSINAVSIWKKQFDYIADESISGQTMADIANSNKILHPRFDKPISSTQMKQPKIADFKRIDF